jgi:hypothetical protein
MKIDIMELFDQINPFKMITKDLYKDDKGREICYSKEEKERFDKDEKMNMSELYNKYYNAVESSEIDMCLYLCKRGLMYIDPTIRGRGDGFPYFKWKSVQDINWLNNHIPQESVLIEEPEEVEWKYE